MNKQSCISLVDIKSMPEQSLKAILKFCETHAAALPRGRPDPVEFEECKRVSNLIRNELGISMAKCFV